MKNTILKPSDKPDIQGLLERILYFSTDGLVIIDRRHTIIYLNTAASYLLGLQNGHVPRQGDNFLSLIKKERISHVKRYIDQAFNNSADKYRVADVTRDRNSWLEISYSPVAAQNDLTHYICIKARDITEKVLLEKKLEAERKDQRNALIKAALDAQEKQRSEIGKELHDNVNQVLTTVKLYNEICLSEGVLDRNMLIRSIQQINYCIETLRSISKDLAPPDIDEMGLKESIRELAESIDATRRISVKFYSYGIRNESVTQALHTTIYRIAQEQLTNILKYANASAVDVVLVGTSSSIALRIHDDGQGFDLNAKRNGVGITNMISRTEAWGGELDIKTAPGAGCILTVEFPLQDQLGNFS